VEFGLKSPAVYKLEAARISKSSLTPFAADKGFELVQTGENAWTIRFEGKQKPVLKNGAALKKSYNLKVELWAEGTYDLDAAGKPIPLTDAKGAAKTKPGIMTVKVSLR